MKIMKKHEAFQKKTRCHPLPHTHYKSQYLASAIEDPATPEMRMCSRSEMIMMLEMVSMLQIYQPRIILNHHESGIVRNHEESS
jgi:hypothetical protein